MLDSVWERCYFENSGPFSAFEPEFAGFDVVNDSKPVTVRDRPPDISTYPKLIREFASEVANQDREKFDEIVQSASRLSWCPKPVNDMVPVKEDEQVTNSPKMLIIKQEETPKSVILPTSNFGSTLHLDTINAFRFKFNQDKGKRKGLGVENFAFVRLTDF